MHGFPIGTFLVWLLKVSIATGTLLLHLQYLGYDLALEKTEVVGYHICNEVEAVAKEGVFHHDHSCQLWL